MLRFGALVLLSIAIGGSVVGAESITLAPARDNTLFESSLGNISGGRADGLFVGRNAQQQTLRRGVIYFDLSAIPNGAVIESASLRMVSNGPGANGDRTVSLHRLLEDWGEGTSGGGGGAGGGGGGPATQNDATWIYRFYNAADPASSPTWSTAGGSFVTTASAASIVASAAGPVIWSSGGMLTDIQMWLNQPSSNFGWEIVGDETNQESTKRFASREHLNLGDRPALTISYSVPEPGTLVVVAIAGMLLVRRR
jgi:hypothetical protein